MTKAYILLQVAPIKSQKKIDGKLLVIVQWSVYTGQIASFLHLVALPPPGVLSVYFGRNPDDGPYGPMLVNYCGA